MPEEPDNLVLLHLRELRAEMNRKLDTVLQELHEIRAEAVADRSRVFGTDHAIQTVQRRLLRTDERVDDLERRLEALAEAR